mmetsp:Transcript_79298/g.256748  ORF Transcript_79298/g.256748 Transcript_79298/m.256748 type:complete len:301 (-) Transcript_79298:786-1688(-)
MPWSPPELCARLHFRHDFCLCSDGERCVAGHPNGLLGHTLDRGGALLHGCGRHHVLRTLHNRDRSAHVRPGRLQLPERRRLGVEHIRAHHRRVAAGGCSDRDRFPCRLGYQQRLAAVPAPAQACPRHARRSHPAPRTAAAHAPRLHHRLREDALLDGAAGLLGDLLLRGQHHPSRHRPQDAAHEGGAGGPPARPGRVLRLAQQVDARALRVHLGGHALGGGDVAAHRALLAMGRGGICRLHHICALRDDECRYSMLRRVRAARGEGRPEDPHAAEAVGPLPDGGRLQEGLCHGGHLQQEP